MLSRLITTFLCAAAIGSVSGAFLTFDPEYIIVEDIEETISFSAKLNSKPTEEVTVYFENPLMPMSTCMIVFNPDNWDAPQQIIAVPAPVFVGSSDLPGPLAFNSPLLAKAVTAGSLPAELSNTDTLEFIRGDAYPNRCSIKKDKVSTFDEIYFLFSKPGWYQMISTKDIEVQVFMDECTAGLLCIKKVLVRYGPTVMIMDVSGPVKSISEYSPTYVTSSTNGLRYAPGPYSNDHIFYFPYGSRLDVIVIDDGGIMSLDVGMFLDSGYPSPGGLCNKPRPRSPENRLIGPDGKSYSRSSRSKAVGFTDSWRVKDADVLTNSGARTLNLPVQQPGTVCTFPVSS
ncbi:hypothetical protein BASA61_007643 [Batrachochytrium salamandrivorans]|nr:hypothetical protein BASA61_007643 [Batrachochytrium salamandrivorans]KAH9271002.1 hypothetical protein BASA83_006754 [Batrachochytrium salamandrivorans]